jgi:hypothetical protein
MEKVNIDENIIIIKNFISKEECDLIIKSAESCSQSDWDIYTNSKRDSRNEWSDRILDFKKAKNFDDSTKKIIDEIFLKLQFLLNIHYKFNYQYSEMFAIYRTKINQRMKVHYDQGGDSKVKYGAVLYLNDDYEGGEIYYPNVNIKIKPQCGDLVIHPTDLKYSHGVKTVKNGIRYCTTTFLF